MPFLSAAIEMSTSSTKAAFHTGVNLSVDDHCSWIAPHRHLLPLNETAAADAADLSTATLTNRFMMPIAMAMMRAKNRPLSRAIRWSGIW